jgi:hypothetical protein
MFYIRVLPEQEKSSTGERLGQICIGNFSEKFVCSLTPVEKLESNWTNQLRSLIEGAYSVALLHDSRFAWIVYREDRKCFVQQALSLTGGFIEHLDCRVTKTEDGEPISEWSTTIEEISEFIGA